MTMLTVMVVDDDETFRAWVKEALADLAVVVEVATPIEALWALERTRVDLVLCDLRLATSTNGIEVLTAVKDLWPQVGRILVTGSGCEVDWKLSAHAFVGKPCSVATLRGLIPLVHELTGVPHETRVD